MNNFTNFSVKPGLEMVQTYTATMEKVVRANLEAVSQISKAFLDACNSYCKVADEAASSGISTKTTAK